MERIYFIMSSLVRFNLILSVSLLLLITSLLKSPCYTRAFTFDLGISFKKFILQVILVADSWTNLTPTLRRMHVYKFF